MSRTRKLRRKNNASYTTFPIAEQEVLNRLIDLARESPEASLAYDLHRQGRPLAECLFGAMELAYRELKMRRETEMYERLARPDGEGARDARQDAQRAAACHSPPRPAMNRRSRP